MAHIESCILCFATVFDFCREFIMNVVDENTCGSVEDVLIFALYISLLLFDVIIQVCVINPGDLTLFSTRSHRCFLG